MMNWFNSAPPIEKYILSVLSKNKNSVNLAYNEIFAKYPFFKMSALKQIIGEVLDKHIKKEKIGGIWSKINKEWKLVADSVQWSGPDMPASQDQNSGGPGLGTYSKPQGQPSNYQVPEPKMNFEHHNVPSDKEMQTIYEQLFDEFVDTFDTIAELNKMIVDELKVTYGNKILRLKLRREKE